MRNVWGCLNMLCNSNAIVVFHLKRRAEGNDFCGSVMNFAGVLEYEEGVMWWYKWL